jgi:hypothetical protein
MRLLNIEDNGEFSLIEYMDEREIPGYAILSHRWGEDSDEVTLKDIRDRTGRTKIGYKKIRACAKQAVEDGLKLIWVDTCCIDKTSSAELSEAINSMWRWYRESKFCYAFLNDVPANTSIDTMAGAIAFSKSQWFTRGWTLQELLAPSEVIFYDAAWQRIGTKDELSKSITDTTKISSYYLASDLSRLAQASIAEKMSWASTRKTKRLEDVAYSLLGIFDINMPLLYGEGAKAFQRLQEEIMKQSDDHSILAWAQIGSSVVVEALLAPSPAHFEKCGNIVRNINVKAIKPYTMTNRGLQAEFRVLSHGDEVIAVLNCRYEDDFFCDLGLTLFKHNEGQYRRGSGPVRKIPVSYWSRGTLRTLYLMLAPGSPSSRSNPSDSSCLIRNLPKQYKVVKDHVPSKESRSAAYSKSGISIRSMILVEHRHSCDAEMFPSFIVIIFDYRHILGMFQDARILPLAPHNEPDLSEVYTGWRRALNPWSLSRVWKMKSDKMIARVVPQLWRGKDLLVVDVGITSSLIRLFLELVVQWSAP